ncbi:MAG: DUF4364 family protein [Clostridia bacterium]|nr:DUF4364 family protein [Clostridia bacterium]
MSKDFELFDNKIIVLYILDKSTKPLTVEQIVKFCEEFEDITYFDIVDYIEKLKNSEYVYQIIDQGTVLYKLTSSGNSMLNELLELIPGVNLHNLKKIINKNIVEVKTDYSINTQIIPIKSEEYKVSCYIKDGNDELVNISIYAGTKEQAKNISKNWQENAENIYSKLLELMTKD